MKIYYAHSIRGNHLEGERSPFQVIDFLKGTGHNVLSEEIRTTGSNLSEEEIYQRDIQMIRESDLIVANVTNPSLGVGYEIGFAEALGKKIISFCQHDKNINVSAMLIGNPNHRTFLIREITELGGILEKLV